PIKLTQNLFGISDRYSARQGRSDTRRILEPRRESVFPGCSLPPKPPVHGGFGGAVPVFPAILTILGASMVLYYWKRPWPIGEAANS
ncbi:MAG: hypothetical protein RLZZ532_4088, partial [Cyanobacteriota bacterium]